MRRMLPALSLLGACAWWVPAPRETGDSGDDGDTGDTGLPVDSAETGETAETGEPGRTPDYSVWAGERRFVVDVEGYACDAVVQESGLAVTNTIALERFQAACPSCERFYAVEVDVTTVCTYITLASPDWRGLALDDGGARVYALSDPAGDGVTAVALDEDASFDGWDLRYTYAESVWGTTLAEVTGRVSFPAASL